MFKQLSGFCLVLIAMTACATEDDVVTESTGLTGTIEDGGNISRDEWREYGPFEVPDGAVFSVTLKMTSGDADLYASVGQAPTLNNADCKPYLGGTQTEECVFDGPATVYVAISGYAWNTDFKLGTETSGVPDSTCGDGVVDEGEVCDGNAIACSELDSDWRYGEVACLNDCSGWDEAACVPSHPEHYTDSGAVLAGRWRHFGPFNASGGAFTAALEGTGDADLYVRRGAAPTNDEYDCRSNGYSTDENCELSGEGLYYVSVLGYATTSDYTIEVDHLFTYLTGRVRANEPSGSVTANEWAYFGPYHHGAGLIQVVLSGTNDADLYVKHGSKPTETSWDCRPYGSTTNEFCDLGEMGSGELWVGVRGYSASAEFDVMAVWVME